MADKEVILGHATNTDGTGGVRILLHDNGNGTYSLSTSADFTGTLSIGNIAIDQTTPGISNNVAVNGDHTTKLSDLLGTDATGVLVPAGATGLRGWLSSIWNVLQARIPILGAHGGLPVEGVASGTPVPVSGAVGVSGNVTIGSSALPVNAAQENGGHLANVDLHIGTPADAVTGWTNQAVAPASEMAVLGQLVKQLIQSIGIPTDAQRYWDDSSPANLTQMVAELTNTIDYIQGNGLSVYEKTVGASGTLSATSQYATTQSAVWSGTIQVNVTDPGSPAFVGSYKFRGSYPTGAVAYDIPVRDLATGEFVPAGTALTSGGDFQVLGGPYNGFFLERLTCTAGQLNVSIVGTRGESTFQGIPGKSSGGVGTVQDAANQPKHLSAIANTLVKDRAGLLGRVVVNKAGAGGNTLTLYDGTDAGGAVLAVIDTTVIGQREYQVAFTTGLYAVLVTGTAADVTLTYA